MSEMIVLVDEQGEKIGTGEKIDVHRKGLLHEAFSVFVFNKKGEVLLQKRAAEKYHSGGLWANTSCSHVREDEALERAVHRCLLHEMGFDCELKKVFSFTYKKEFDNGLTEYEYDHVFVGQYDGTVDPNFSEVSDYRWVSWESFLDEIKNHPEKFVYWLKKIVELKPDLHLHAIN